MKSMAGLVEHGLVPLILASRDSGLLEALDRSPGTAEELAGALRLHPRATRLVLDALHGLGICTRDAAGVFGRLSGFEREIPWRLLGSFLATGEVDPMIDGARRGEGYAPCVGMLGDRFEPCARALGTRLGPADSILDVGAGSGVWSLAMAAITPTANVTAIDLPPVVPRFLERAAALGLQTRVQALAGSYFEVEPPGTFDRVVLANILHLERPTDAAALVARAARWVSPAGELVIIDCVGEGEAHEPWRSLYALHLGLRTARGAVHPPAELQAWCTHAGLTESRVVLMENFPAIGAFVAQRAG